jgi:P27 family predicted phage terminase small subunit
MAKYKIDDNLEQEVRVFMKDVVNKLKEDGKIDESWTAGLTMMAQNYNTFIECQRTIKKDGLTITNRFGDMVAHPLIKVSENASIQLQKLLIEFLLTKKSIIKLPDYQPEEEATELESFFKQKNNKVEKR